MKFEFYCVQCGKNKEVVFSPKGADPHLTIKRMIENEDWIVQMNYPYLDIYCSKKCAA